MTAPEPDDAELDRRADRAFWLVGLPALFVLVLAVLAVMWCAK